MKNHHIEGANIIGAPEGDAAINLGEQHLVINFSHVSFGEGSRFMLNGESLDAKNWDKFPIKYHGHIITGIAEFYGRGDVEYEIKCENCNESHTLPRGHDISSKSRAKAVKYAIGSILNKDCPSPQSSQLYGDGMAINIEVDDAAVIGNTVQ